MISCKNVNKTYSQGDSKIEALKDISYDFQEGKITTIQGKSGSGKSTLLKIIGLVENVTSGSVIIDGNNVTEYNDRKKSEIRNKKIAFITQDFSLIETSTVEFNVLLPLYIGKSFDKSRDLEKMKNVLEKLEISKYQKTKVNKLSGGERQRVAIARAIMSDCDTILADEPTGSLDSQVGHSIIDYLVSLNEMGKTIIMVTHDDEFAKIGHIQLKMADGMILNK